MPTVDETEIEQLIDRHSLTAVLNAIATVCSEKADHIRMHYSAKDQTAKDWDRAGDRVQAVAAWTEICKL